MSGIFRNKFAPLILLVLLIVAFLIGTLLTKKSAEPQQSSVKGVFGVINLNGVVPQGGTITLLQRRVGTADPFTPFVTGLTPTDGGFWGFKDAIAGGSYEIQGVVVQNGEVVYQTSPVFATAPAINEVLIFNIPSPAPVRNATIAGAVGINGYIPPNATLTLQAKKPTDQAFTTITQNIPARDQQFITYATALSGQAYIVKALLYDGSYQLIGESSPLTLVAPAYNEALEINSLAQAPVTPRPKADQPLAETTTPQPQATSTTAGPTATPIPVVQLVVSGAINFNGQAPPNSRIVIFERVSGTQNYQVAVDNINPQDGTTWQWNGAVSGSAYDMIAILKQKQPNGSDRDISNSNTLSFAAPAANELFTINSGFLLPSPGSTISVACSNYDGGSQMWNAGISFGTIANAQSYWYQIGTTNGGIELTNFTQNATNNSSQGVTEQFKNGVTYYARYAYANVSNLLGNSPQFSPFSSTVQLRCSQ